MPKDAPRSFGKRSSKLVEDTLRASAGSLEEAFFKVPLWESHNGSKREFDLMGWLRSERAPVAVLSAPLGAGKTVATCLL